MVTVAAATASGRRRARSDRGEQVAGGDGVTHRDVDLGDGAVDTRLDAVLHLHRLDYDDWAGGRDEVAHARDLHDGALQRRPELPHGEEFYRNLGMTSVPISSMVCITASWPIL